MLAVRHVCFDRVSIIICLLLNYFSIGFYILQRVMVSCRADAKRVEAKGLFAGAEVVRGPNWRFGDQDGK